MEKSLKRLWYFVVSTLLVLATGTVWSELPLRDAVSMQPVSDFSLHADIFYLIFAPWLNVLDLMSSLSLTQHMAWVLFLWILASYAIFKCIQNFKPHFHRLFVGFFATVLGFVSMLLLYAIAILMPRPMITLVVPQQDMVVVDFHSHTNASHDANTYFSAEDNRWWHQYAGFNAVFVTDHSEFSGIQAGKKYNAKQAKGGVQLLDGVEVFHKGGHILALCVKHITQINQEYIWKKHADEPCSPLLVQALPAPLSDSDARFRERKIEAIEINDGAPLGLEEIKHRHTLLEKAKRLNIAVVSGSDNHGWAYAAVGWSVLRIQGWQAMNANQLESAITQHIRKHGFAAVQVVERNMVLPATTIVGHIFMPVRLIWHMFQTLTIPERASWLAWLLLSLIVMMGRQR